MQASMFNVAVPLPGRREVFLMNTFSDAQLIVSTDVASLLEFPPRLDSINALDDEQREAVHTLFEHGFLVENRAAERQALDRYFFDLKHDTRDLRVTVLTTLQCNFACDYCFQGDHGDHNLFAEKMTLATAARVAEWIEERLEALGPQRLVLTFFGGEPLLNLPVLYDLADRCHAAAGARGIPLAISLITNGLLLTPEVVDRLLPLGLTGIKITLDGDRDTHNRMRPLRGGQGTFDKIVANIRRVAGRCPIAIGGNFDASSVDSFPALIEFLSEQDFAPLLSRVNFKPIIREQAPPAPKGFIPLTAVTANGKPLGGTCMTTAGAGTRLGGSICDSCHFVDEKLSMLRDETRRRGFQTADGVHMGPCQIHKKHAYTIGPEGSLYACPGFTGEKGLATGHIDGRQHREPAEKFDRLAAWENCGDCSFIPVCGGGCTVASHTELGDINAPSCHKASFEAAMTALAEQAAATA
jgi:uncharacterized protein